MLKVVIWGDHHVTLPALEGPEMNITSHGGTEK